MSPTTEKTATHVLEDKGVEQDGTGSLMSPTTETSATHVEEYEGVEQDVACDYNNEDDHVQEETTASVLEIDVTNLEIRTKVDHMCQSGTLEGQSVRFHQESSDAYLMAFPRPEIWEETSAGEKALYTQKWNSAFLRSRPDVDANSLGFYEMKDLRSITNVVQREEAKKAKKKLNNYVNGAFAKFQLRAYCASPISEVAIAAVEKKAALAKAKAEAAAAKNSGTTLPALVSHQLSESWMYFFMI